MLVTEMPNFVTETTFTETSRHRNDCNPHSLHYVEFYGFEVRVGGGEFFGKYFWTSQKADVW